MKTKRTSLNDIAKALSVSKATVSFVLNDKGDQFNISKKKQELIRSKAKELSYVPNFFAKSLRQGSTKTIGLVLPDISNPFYGELCKTIQQTLFDAGYSTYIINSNDDKEQETTLMRGLIQRCIDGMIIVPSNDIKEIIPVLHETHIPVVFTDRPGDDLTDFIGIDNKKEAEKLVNSFKNKPKKITAFASEELDANLKLRIDEIQEACKKMKVNCEVITLTKNQKDSDKIIQEQLKKGSDAFVSLNSRVIFKIVSSLHTLQAKIGTDVKLISFDDHEAFTYMSPSISAIQQPVLDIAIQAAERMVERLADDSLPSGKQIVLDCEFKARESH
ncbi:MAG TPA: LacI family transcriptional regulator [Crocinitomicaceae bacterium]|nr:LacI family transcriptional regulator [Crocinitomicaceae bacterium]